MEDALALSYVKQGSASGGTSPLSHDTEKFPAASPDELMRLSGNKRSSYIPFVRFHYFQVFSSVYSFFLE